LPRFAAAKTPALKLPGAAGSAPTKDIKPMLTRLINYWVYGGALAGLLFLVLLPALAGGWSLALTAVVLQLPIYMLHQYEEHDNDRFRLFFNRTIFGGREVLSRAAVFMINVPGVWGVIAVSIYLARFVDIGFGLIAVYLTLVNALVHVLHAVVFHRYNPGLATAVGLFLPVGGYGLWQIERAGGGDAAMQMLGLGVAVVVHAAMLAYARHKSGTISLPVAV
jgi:hypothetical protein